MRCCYCTTFLIDPDKKALKKKTSVSAISISEFQSDFTANNQEDSIIFGLCIHVVSSSRDFCTYKYMSYMCEKVMLSFHRWCCNGDGWVNLPLIRCAPSAWISWTHSCCRPRCDSSFESSLKFCQYTYTVMGFKSMSRNLHAKYTILYIICMYVGDIKIYRRYVDWPISLLGGTMPGFNATFFASPITAFRVFGTFSGKRSYAEMPSANCITSVKSDTTTCIPSRNNNQTSYTATTGSRQTLGSLAMAAEVEASAIRLQSSFKSSNAK